jgi:hypothetical protein
VNADIPYLHCYVRGLSDQGSCEEAYAFAVQSMRGRAIGIHCMLKSGAHYRNVPLHAICTREDATRLKCEDLAYWDCFSNRPVVTVFDFLRDHECIAYLPNGQRERGVYLWTVDWLPDDAVHPAFILEPDQNKCGHFLRLESGNVCMLPTNKIAWRDGYWIGSSPSPESQKYKIQTEVHHAESATQDFSKSDQYYY